MAKTIDDLGEDFFKNPEDDINPRDEYAKALMGEPIDTGEGKKDDGKAMEPEDALVTEEEAASMKKEVPARGRRKKGSGNSKKTLGGEADDIAPLHLVAFKMPAKEYAALKSMSIIKGIPVGELLRKLAKEYVNKHREELKKLLDA